MSRQTDMDNHANQLNPNNDAYWESRGYNERPDDREDRIPEGDGSPHNRQAESRETERRRQR